MSTARTQVPSQLTGAPQSIDWWEVTGARADAALGETAPPPRCGGAPRFAVLFEGCPIPLKVAWTACGWGNWPLEGVDSLSPAQL